jgi:hypothetical protein
MLYVIMIYDSIRRPSYSYCITIKVTDCPIHKYTLLTYCGKYLKESKDVKYQISLPEKIVANSDVDIVLI